MSQQLISRLDQVRRKQATVFSATGVSIALGFVVLALALEMLVDWGIQWPWADTAGLAWIVRAGILALMLAGLVWIVLNRVLGPWIFGPDDEELALAVEREEPDLRGRLISAVQLSRPEAVAAGVSKSLVKALVTETEQMVADRDFDRIIKMEALYRAGSVALLLLIMGILGWAICRPSSNVLLRRAFLSNEPVPRKTRVNVITGDIRVPRGESVTIVAQADGVKPASGTIDVAYPNASYSFTLDADPDVKGQYLRKIDNVTSSFRYAIRLNDGRSDRHYNVEAVDRPDAVTMNCVQIYPEYIKLPDQPHLPGDLSMVAGSRLVVSIVSNKPLAVTSPRQFPFNRVHLSGSEKDYPLAVDSKDPTKATTQDVDGKRGIPLPKGTTGISIYLVDTEGIESKSPTNYRIELIPDKPPVIHIKGKESHDSLATRVASPHINFDAYDDYALGRITLRYTVNAGPMQEIPVPLNPAHPQSVSGAVDFPLANVPSPDGSATLEGATVVYWLHAEDQNTVSNPNQQPGMCDSEQFTVKVVTEDEKRRELDARAGMIPTTIDPITQSEEDSSKILGDTIIHGGNATTQPTTQPTPQK